MKNITKAQFTSLSPSRFMMTVDNPSQMISPWRYYNQTSCIFSLSWSPASSCTSWSSWLESLATPYCCFTYTPPTPRDTTSTLGCFWPACLWQSCWCWWCTSRWRWPRTSSLRRWGEGQSASWRSTSRCWLHWLLSSIWQQLALKGDLSFIPMVYLSPSCFFVVVNMCS